MTTNDTNRTGKLVVVDWRDSHYVSGWHTDEPSQQPLLCRSAGWLVHEGEAAITIAAHMTDEEIPQRAGEMTIPVQAVVSVEVLG